MDRHDLLLAEGAPSESFIDDDSRGMFHNAAEYTRLYPDAPAPGTFCAPRVTDGYRLEAIRRRLAEVAGRSRSSGMTTRAPTRAASAVLRLSAGVRSMP